MHKSLPVCALLALSLAPVSAFAVDPPEVQRARCDRPFQTAFRGSSGIEMDLRSGDIEIVGWDESKVSVDCSISSEHEARDIAIRFEDDGKLGRLHITGGHDNDKVRIRIRVPRNSNLVVRCTAGDLDLIGVRGHKDVSLRAGDLTIDVGDPGDYRSAEASVKAGDLHASAFGVHKGGLFRSFRHENRTGKYRLRASLWAGDLTLQGSR